MKDCQTEILQTVHSLCQEHLVLGTWGNVSTREAQYFWITPSGMPYDCLKHDDLIKIDLATGQAAGPWKASTEWPLHAAIYRGRPDCAAVVHTHSVYATAFAVANLPIPPVVEDLVQIVGGGVAVADYALPGSKELAQQALLALADNNAVLLANHGLVGIGKSLTEALTVCRIVEKTAQVVIQAKALGPIREISQSDIKVMRQFYVTAYGPGHKREERP
ncbi:MAG TPA: class II aldolase/adducin family protein [Oscillospiraceae bacterium]|nr:class II aldolase/adducin family protein [Oscillospiraceae bacterium]